MEAFYPFKSGFNEVNVHFLSSKSLQVDFFVLQDFSISLTVPRLCPKWYWRAPSKSQAMAKLGQLFKAETALFD